MAAPQNGPIVFLLGDRTSHADFMQFARAKEWLLHEDSPSTGPRSAYEQVWVTPDRSTAIHYMDDPTPEERFLVVYGRHTGTIAFQLGAADLDVYTSEDVFEWALLASTDAERITTAWQLAVVTKVYNETILDLLKSLYYDGTEIVRQSVINAVGYRGWPDAKAFLEEVSRIDASPDLRENAHRIVDAWWGNESLVSDP